MKKKLLSCFVLMLLMAVTLYATGGQQQSATGLVDIELWYGGSVSEAAPPPANWEVFQTVRDRLNINLIITQLPASEQDSTTRINAAAAANQLPDLFQVSRDAMVNLMRTGQIAPTDDLYRFMPQRSQHFGESGRSYVTINGQAWGFPGAATIIRNEGLVIRKDWLDNLGLAVPRTMDELWNVMVAFRTMDPDRNGRHDTYGFGAAISSEISTMNAGLGTRFDPFFAAYGVAGTFNMSTTNPGFNIRNPAYFDALSYVRRMFVEDVIDPNSISYTRDDFRAAWKQGRFGIMREQMAALHAENNYAPFDANFPDGEWIVIDPPTGPTGLSGAMVYTDSYRIYSVSTRAMDAGKGQRIAEFLEWLSTDGYFTIGWGKEGENFVFDADGAPTGTGAPRPFSAAENVSVTQLRNMIFYNSFVELLSRYPTYITANSRKEMSSLRTLYDMQGRRHVASVGAETAPPPNPDARRYYDQGILEFITGTRQLTRDNWNAWVAGFDRVGGTEWERSAVEHFRANGLLRPDWPRDPMPVGWRSGM